MSLVDLQELVERFQGDVDVVTRITALFLDSWPQLLTEVEEAIASKDPERLEHAAHSIKGVIASFSMQSPYQLALRLEQFGANRSIEQADRTLAELRRELNLLSEELRRFLSESQASNAATLTR